MTPQRVTLITLGVADLAASRAFYAALGWCEHRESQPGVAFYQMHGAALALFGRADLAADQGRPGAALGTGAATLAQNFSTEAEVDAAYAAALAVGATALKAPEKVFWGGYSGYWADPDGHVWEVAMNPFWPLATDGSLTLPESSP
ncbi:VOC family protein [Paracoccaceae bacterium]